MKYVAQYNLWWPDFEDPPNTGLVRMMKRVSDCDVVTEDTRTKGVAVQAGGHIGLWARQLAKQFALVHSFEPGLEMYGCLVKNTQYTQNIVAHNAALGAKSGVVSFSDRCGGKSKVMDRGDYDVPITTIDAQELPRCDLIYLDIERYELQALKGARETIANFKPVIAIEILDGERDRAKKFMQEIGYKDVRQIHSDWVFVPC